MGFTPLKKYPPLPIKGNLFCLGVCPFSEGVLITTVSQILCLTLYARARKHRQFQPRSGRGGGGGAPLKNNGRGNGVRGGVGWCGVGYLETGLKTFVPCFFKCHVYYVLNNYSIVDDIST